MMSGGGNMKSSLRSRLPAFPGDGRRFVHTKNDNEADHKLRTRIPCSLSRFSVTILVVCFIVWWRTMTTSISSSTSSSTLRQESVSSTTTNNNNNAIPKLIFSSCKTKDKIPPKVYKTIRTVAPDYEYHLFDDNECVAWLNQTYNSSVSQKYTQLRNGAHKADFFRYAILLQMGGIWVDVDLKPLVPFSQVFHHDEHYKNVIYTCANDVVIFQAVLATPANNVLIKSLFEHAMTTTPRRYEHYLHEIHSQISLQTNHSGPFETAGLYRGNNDTDFVLFKEKCTRGEQGKLDCPQGLSKKWKSCCYVYDNEGNKVFESRYVDYPWE